MSNNSTRNIYNKGVSGANDDEMESLLNSAHVSQQMQESNMVTTINIDNDMTPGTSQQYPQRQQHLQQIHQENPTRINIDPRASYQQASNGLGNQSIDDRQRLPNLFAMWREARHQFNRSQSLRDPRPPPNVENNAPNTQSRTWRDNLYEVLSSPVSPRAQSQVLRAIFNPSAIVRYETTRTNVIFQNDEFHFSFNQNTNQAEEELQNSSRNNDLETQLSSSFRVSRQSSRLTDERSLNESSTSDPDPPAADTSYDNNGNSRRQSTGLNSNTNGVRPPLRRNSVASSTTAPTVDMVDDAEANAMGELIVKLVTYFIRYLPFIFIIFVKFIHDNLLGILDMLILHSVVYHINKSVKEQIAKLNQKSLVILVRDAILVIFVVSYRFVLSSAAPDPFGLLINPPGTTITLDLSSTQKVEPTNLLPLFANEESTKSLNNTISVTKSISLGSLLYYVAVNDLILKLLTQLVKIIVTVFPTKIVRHKSRARLYAVIETVSQFYRSLVPIRQWLKYLFESYTGLEVISGILFSSFYMGAKLFELFQRGRPLKKAVVNFMRNMDYERKPTKDELEAAGTVCPICHDAFSSPVVLECSHIFCDDCVSTWFKREQTCPMCRAKVSEDPTWQDGATTYFYQLF